MTTTATAFAALARLLLVAYLSLLLTRADDASDLANFMADINTASTFRYSHHFLGKHLQLINTTYTPSNTSTPTQRLSLKYSCRALFHHSKFQNLSTELVNFPKQPPGYMLGSYTFDGAIELHEWYWKGDQFHGGSGYFWPKAMLEEKGKQPSNCGYYKSPVCDMAISKYTHLIAGKSGYVIGTIEPWAESALLAAGAANITTVEYMPIASDHPRISYVHPFNLTSNFLLGHQKGADFAWCFSSLEHDGLGRYGDPLNPFADLESMSRVNCLLKPGGVFFLGLPVGVDAVYWNAHRIYGRLRLFPVLADWDVLDVIGLKKRITSREKPGDWEHQPILVLRKR